MRRMDSRSRIACALCLIGCQSRPARPATGTALTCRLPALDPGVPYLEIDEILAHRESLSGRRICARGVVLMFGLGSVSQAAAGRVDETVEVASIPNFARTLHDRPNLCHDVAIVACGVFQARETVRFGVVGDIRDANVFYIPKPLGLFSEMSAPRQ